MDNFYAKYSANEPATVVTALNGMSGALTLVAGPNITITPGAGTLTISSTGGSGTVTAVTASAPLSSTGGTTPNISITLANASTDGYLSSVDWNTFNNKQAAGSYITALTGDGTASGPGSAALTLATVNGNVGTFGSASSVASITANAKGLITAASSIAIQIAESQVTNLVSDLAGKQATGNYITSLTGEATASGPGAAAVTLTNSAVIGKVLTGYVSGRGTVAATDTILQGFDKLNGNSQIVYNDQTANYTIVASDFNKIVQDTGTTAITFSLTAAATLGDGWYCYIKNTSTGAENAGQLIIDPNGAETIDGAATITTYPGDFRLLTCNGVSFRTRLIQGGAVQYTTAGAATFTLPTKTTFVRVELWGGGGGGGSGRRGAATTIRAAGSGGGGGTYVEQVFKPSDIGVSATVTVAGTAAGGAAITTDSTSGNAGTNGSNSTFGTLLTAFSGSGGRAGAAASLNGGGGGGGLTAGNVSTGGGPNGSTAQQGFGGGSGGTGAGSETGYGGAAGGGSASGSTGGNGGCSIKGGPGGGSGGGITAGDTRTNGGDGGSGQGNLNGGGGAGGTGAGVSGSSGTAGPSPLGPGTAGGGGSSSLVAVGGSGGNGGIAAGGGGGAASLNGFNSGAGGSGGPGLCRIYYE